jgi:hypothetical protein
MAKQAKEVLEVEALTAVADRVYFNGEGILAREQAGYHWQTRAGAPTATFQRNTELSNSLDPLRSSGLAPYNKFKQGATCLGSSSLAHH